MNPHPYSTLLRIGFSLWWRYWTVWLCITGTLLVALLTAEQFNAAFREAVLSSRVDRDFFLLGVLPVLEALLAFPLAVRWFRRTAAPALGVSVAYRGKDVSVLEQPHRQALLFGWSVFFMPLAWEVANALLIHALFADSPGTPRVWLAITAIYANVALLHLLAFLPMNLNWVFGNRFAGVEWTLRESTDQRR